MYVVGFFLLANILACVGLRYGLTTFKIALLLHFPLCCCFRFLVRHEINQTKFVPLSSCVMCDPVQCPSYQFVDFLFKNVDNARSFVWNALTMLSAGPFGYLGETHFMDFLILTFYVLADIICAFVWTNSASVKFCIKSYNDKDNISTVNENGEKISTVNIYVNKQRQDLTYSEFIERIKLIFKQQRVRSSFVY